jgi:hypothetical protein
MEILLSLASVAPSKTGICPEQTWNSQRTLNLNWNPDDWISVIPTIRDNHRILDSKALPN